MSFDLPRSVSPSSLSQFTSCPLAYRFSYVERLPQRPTPAASKGTLVHRALELLMLRPADERTIDAALSDLEIAATELATDSDFTGLDLTEAEWETFHADSRKLVERYFTFEDPRLVRPIGLELRMRTQLAGGLWVSGVIDRLELDENGDFVVTDYKTGAVPREQMERSRLSGVHLYAVLCERVFGRRPVRVQLLYLSKPEAIIAEVADNTMGGSAKRTNAIWKAITRACETEDFRPHQSKLCDYCSYQAYCPAFGGDPDQARELLDDPNEPRLPAIV